jgi:hypothetical protein
MTLSNLNASMPHPTTAGNCEQMVGWVYRLHSYVCLPPSNNSVDRLTPLFSVVKNHYYGLSLDPPIFSINFARFVTQNTPKIYPDFYKDYVVALMYLSRDRGT